MVEGKGHGHQGNKRREGLQGNERRKPTEGTSQLVRRRQTLAHSRPSGVWV